MIDAKRGSMYNLHIEHQVPDFGNWKKAFDSDPVGRKRMGVRTYQIQRDVNNQNYIIIDLQFDTVQQAEALLAAMRNVWKQVDGKIMVNPQARISEIVVNEAVSG